MVNAEGHILDANISLNKWVALLHSLFVIVGGLIPPAEAYLATWWFEFKSVTYDCNTYYVPSFFKTF